MKLLKSPVFLMGLLVTGVLLPFQAYASAPPTNGVPEPVSLALLAIGAAGVGAAAWIRRSKDK
jgi:PEP-CTERM motif